MIETGSRPPSEWQQRTTNSVAALRTTPAHHGSAAGETRKAHCVRNKHIRSADGRSSVESATTKLRASEAAVWACTVLPEALMSEHKSLEEIRALTSRVNVGRRCLAAQPNARPSFESRGVEKKTPQSLQLTQSSPTSMTKYFWEGCGDNYGRTLSA